MILFYLLVFLLNPLKQELKSLLLIFAGASISMPPVGENKMEPSFLKNQLTGVSCLAWIDGCAIPSVLHVPLVGVNCEVWRAKD